MQHQTFGPPGFLASLQLQPETITGNDAVLRDLDLVIDAVVFAASPNDPFGWEDGVEKFGSLVFNHMGSGAFHRGKHKQRHERVQH